MLPRPPTVLWAYVEVTEENVHLPGDCLMCPTSQQQTQESWADAPSDWACPQPHPRPLFSTTTSPIAVKEFAIIPLHAAPVNAVAEINSLYDVYLDVRQKWDMEVNLPHIGLGSGGLCSTPGPSNWLVSPGRTSC